MRQEVIWAAVCVGGGILCGGLAASLAHVRGQPESPLPALERLAGSMHTADPGTARHTAAEPSEAPDPVRSSIRVLAQKLAEPFAADAWAELGERLDPGAYRIETRILTDSANGSRWVTETALRVSCQQVDRALARHADRQLGEADRCDRWLRAAAQTLELHGIRDRTSVELLDELGADRSVRVLLLYAGWERPATADGRIKLIEARSAPVYPEAQFRERRNEAQNAIFRVMRLGPYAEGL